MPDNTPQFYVKELRGKKKMGKNFLQSYMRKRHISSQACISLQLQEKEWALSSIPRKGIDIHHHL